MRSSPESIRDWSYLYRCVQLRVIARRTAVAVLSAGILFCGPGRAISIGAVVTARPASTRSRILPAGPVSLPAGTQLFLRLDTAVSTKTSHLRGPIVARVVRDVPGPDRVAIPVGAVVRGRIEKLIPTSSPTDRARVLLQFTQLEIPGQSSLALKAHLREVENGRETVLMDGTIRGVLASELPLAHLEKAVENLGKDGKKLQEMQQKAFGKSDTSIEYPPGADLVVVLDQSLGLPGQFDPSVPQTLAKGVQSAVQALLAEAPQRAAGKDDTPGDPLNLVLVGNDTQIRHAFQDGGWSEAEKKDAQSIWETVRAVAGDQGFGRAPVSQLYLYGHAEDFAFEKMLNTFVKRHHLRLWRSPAKTPDGREIWLGAATHDTGLDVRPGVLSHAIDPNLDDERDKVGADLAVSGRVAADLLVTRPNALSEGLTATGAPWKTDGRLLVIELKGD